MFLLVCNLHQVSGFVKSVYGDIDSEKYLEKFYQLRVSLPNQTMSPRTVRSVAEIYFEHLRCDRNYYHPIIYISRKHDVGLRTIERIVTLINITKESVGNNRFKITLMLGMLCAMKVMATKLYYRACNSTVKMSEIDEFAGFSEWDDGNGGGRPIHLAELTRNYWCYFLGENLEETVIRHLKQELFTVGLGPESIIPYFGKLIDGIYFP